MDFEQFERELSALCKTHERSFRSISQYIQQHLSLVSNGEELYNVCKILLDSVVEYACSNSDEVLKIVKVYNRWKNYEHYDSESEEEMLCKQIVAYVLTPLLYYDVENCNDLCDEMTASWMAFITLDEEYANALIKYGMLKPEEITSPEDEPNHLIEILLRSWDNILTLYEPENENGVTREDAREIVYLLQRVNGQMHHQNRRGFKRIGLVLIFILLLTRRNSCGYNKTIEVVRLYFKITPDPFVATEDIQEFLRFLLRDKKYMELAAGDFAEQFSVVWMEEFGTDYSPKSLKYLCRHRIRTVLSERKKTLPNLVRKLPLPEILKDFLLGKDTSDRNSISYM